jgi:hypothetical protein
MFAMKLSSVEFIGSEYPQGANKPSPEHTWFTFPLEGDGGRALRGSAKRPKGGMLPLAPGVQVKTNQSPDELCENAFRD